MDDYFFNGVWRLDIGLGNPNKTAAFIAQLMVAIWCLPYLRKRGFWFALGLFTLLGGCLIHTFSRGGLVATFVGLAILLVFSKRPWPTKRLLATIGSILLLSVFALYINAHTRYIQGVLKEDRSLTNRAILWMTAPVMMTDAPSGWGMGNSGKAFMQWYQPIQCTERYRTLVSSHLTWLVEFGWLLRFSYIFAWAIVAFLCFPTQHNRWMSIPFGIWATFGTAMLFSSVAESPILWIIPALALSATIAYRIKTSIWLGIRAWLFALGFAVCACLAVALIGGGKSEISGSLSRVVIGKKPISTWLVVDEAALGGKYFAKRLRQYLIESSHGQGVGVVWSLADLPKDTSNAIVVVAGTPGGMNPKQWERISNLSNRIILLAPGYYPQETGMVFNKNTPIEVLFGEFSQSVFFTEWMQTGKIHLIDNVGDFLPNWPDIILNTAADGKNSDDDGPQ